MSSLSIEINMIQKRLESLVRFINYKQTDERGIHHEELFSRLCRFVTANADLIKAFDRSTSKHLDEDLYYKLIVSTIPACDNHYLHVSNDEGVYRLSVYFSSEDECRACFREWEPKIHDQVRPSLSEAVVDVKMVHDFAPGIEVTVR